MKRFFISSLAIFLVSLTQLFAQSATTKLAVKPQLFIDVHHLSTGKVSFKDVAAAHMKDLAVEGKYGVKFLKFWVDEKNGDVYCLSSAADTGAIVETHREAHGLLPQEIHAVTDGDIAQSNEGAKYFLDIHSLGAGKVKAADVAKAHQKDLAVQDKYGVKFINYWVDEEEGMVYCLSQAKNATKVVATHKEAHGLLPLSIVNVKQGE